MYKAVAYLRISNADDNTGESGSLINQRKFIYDFTSNQSDITIISEKIDDGISGLVFNRPSFQEMLAEAINGEIDCIIVKDLSRLGRDYVQTCEYLRNVFPRLGIRFISILDNIDTNDDIDLSEKLDVTLKTILNDSYSRDISRKTRSAVRSKQKNGEYCGANPIYGYMKSPDNKNALVIDEDAAVVVREIFSLKKDGYSASKIADILNKRNVQSPSVYKDSKRFPKSQEAPVNNSLWSAQTIIRLLKETTYTGTLTQGKVTTFNYKTKKVKPRPKDEWAITPNAHKPIISNTDFYLVQKLMNLDTRTSPDKENVYLFSGLLVCESCGNRMVRKTVLYNGKKYFYYSCTTGKKKGCNNKSIKEEKLISIITKCVQVFVQSVGDLESLLAKDGIFEVQEALKQTHFKRLEEIEVKKTEISKYKANLYESLLQEVITNKEYTSYKKTYDDDLVKLVQEEEKEKLNYTIQSEGNIPEWITSFTEFRDLTTLNRRIVIELLQSIVIGEKIKLNFRHQVDYDLMKATLTS